MILRNHVEISISENLKETGIQKKVFSTNFFLLLLQRGFMQFLKVCYSWLPSIFNRNGPQTYIFLRKLPKNCLIWIELFSIHRADFQKHAIN